MIRADQVTEGHQLQIRMRAGQIVVTCPCLLRRVRSQDYRPYRIGGVTTQRRQSYWQREIIAARPKTFPATEAVAAYRDWHAGKGIEVSG